MFNFDRGHAYRFQMVTGRPTKLPIPSDNSATNGYWRNCDLQGRRDAVGCWGWGGCSDFECRRHQVFSIQVSLSVLNNAARITHSIKSAGVRDFRLHCLLRQWESRVWGTIFCRYVIRIVPRERKGAGEIKKYSKINFLNPRGILPKILTKGDLLSSST